MTKCSCVALSLETGRLHPETLQLFDKVEKHYGIRIEYTFPDAQETTDLIRAKGLFSFYEDGHQECCRIRKVSQLIGARNTVGNNMGSSPFSSIAPISNNASADVMLSWQLTSLQEQVWHNSNIYYCLNPKPCQTVARLPSFAISMDSPPC